MNNPTLSLLQANPVDNGLQLAQRALSMAPKMISMPKKEQASIIKPPMNQSRYQEMADDLIRYKTLKGEYSKAPSNLLDYIAGYETPGYKDPYSAVNKSTGAYGRYQFIPSTMRAYADKLGVTVDQFKSNPSIQDQAAMLKLQDLKRELSAYGIPLTDKNIYLGWNQGAKGLYDLLQGKSNYKALDLNLPKGIERTPQSFLNYWYNK
jgi:hypothetical protein